MTYLSYFLTLQLPYQVSYNHKLLIYQANKKPHIFMRGFSETHNGKFSL
ncbi:hypothetical protein VS_0295 [Vibrio atlanticus]|uniref:Uncharacterized protein n=1 Tax=Vibrio atlanticus (strain LGP32) TaxID=575788 RepID=B7VI80_VIBA3|nr:hypothetical protein VS_0295 [Vibrio atlanticus]